MSNLQLEIQPQTARRLRKVLKCYPDQESFVQSIISYQIAELKQSILNLHLDLQEYEEQYQLETEDFYQQFSQGKTDDRENYLIWAGVYELLCKNEERLQELR
ncbi:MAG TPA: hypothetical protein G4N98_05085 [Thermoflexia bacterium]|nr:hypothetical protein [Thermoflexia bacterium]